MIVCWKDILSLLPLQRKLTNASFCGYFHRKKKKTLSYGLTNTPTWFFIASLWLWPLIPSYGEVASTNLLHSSSPEREDTFHFMDEENKVQKSYIMCPKLDGFELWQGKHKDQDSLSAKTNANTVIRLKMRNDYLTTWNSVVILNLPFLWIIAKSKQRHS